MAVEASAASAASCVAAGSAPASSSPSSSPLDGGVGFSDIDRVVTSSLFSPATSSAASCSSASASPLEVIDLGACSSATAAQPPPMPDCVPSTPPVVPYRGGRFDGASSSNFNSLQAVSNAAAVSSSSPLSPSGFVRVPSPAQAPAAAPVTNQPHGTVDNPPPRPTLFNLLERLASPAVTTAEQRCSIRGIVTDFLNNDLPHAKVYTYIGSVVGHGVLQGVIKRLEEEVSTTHFCLVKVKKHHVIRPVAVLCY
eukprot:GHVT01101109.1.p1 GENE.GHVT01101109.1~~GHVT01101109.1.p1  ORF type:complete len:253 (-),score=50.88 GHVT01101109.1:436-1194(-)